MKTLFDETRIGPMLLRNRLVRSATWEAMADEAGRLTPRLLELYRQLAEGGVGLIITSATTITKDTTRLHGMLCIPDDSYIPAYRELTQMVHNTGCPIIMQLDDGRTGEMWTPAIPTLEEMQSITREFGDAASRAKQAGFDGVQIHAAHGFFLSQFLNAKKNARTDQYGGRLQEGNGSCWRSTMRSAPGQDLIFPSLSRSTALISRRMTVSGMPVNQPA
jgi:2,4-dienoyl-CoA reductase-like NADH-dependent reductase (Old Yellow Enzyme family)